MREERGKGSHLEVVVLAGECPYRIPVGKSNKVMSDGEGELLGREEIDGIEPAVEKAQRLGLDVVRPIPADTVSSGLLVALGSGEELFDAVVAMYHD